MRKILSKLILIVIMVSIISVSVTAIGLQGSQLFLKGMYESGVTYSYTYTVNFAGTDDQSFVEVTTEGDLADYLHTSVTEIYPLQGDSLEFSVDFIMTDDLPEAGNRMGRVCVLEASTGSGVSARTKSCAVFEMFVLHNGIHPAISFSAVEGGSEVDFSLEVTNLGQEDISSSSAIIEIYSPDEELIETLSINGDAISSSDVVTLSASYNSVGLVAGDYSAKAYVDTDAESTESLTNFKIGTEDVSVVSFTETVEVNGIQKFEVLVSNEWAGSQDVMLKLNVGSQTVDSDEKTIGKWSEENFLFYLETDDFDYGEQSAFLTIFFADSEQREEELPITIVEKSTDNLVVLENDGSNSLILNNPLFLILGVIVVILVLLGTFFVIKKKSDAEEKEEMF
ncbi:hypothetical protein HOA92_01300 [archaeon]|jgi:hypothetical protein|nr:hypothetical protein [archaeon]MBT6761654.1 hypothetical protein [archaeon]